VNGRPLVAVSASLHDFGDYGGIGVAGPLLDAGVVPMGLPQLSDAIGPALDQVSGVVLAPGRDMDPSFYGQEPDPLLAATEPQRDRFELALVPAALERGLPILGICRGIQVLNVARGGTLVQDLRLRDGWHEHPSDPGWHAWRQVERSRLDGGQVPPHPRHSIEVSSDSHLYSALGVEEVTVNSFHHQAVDRLGEGLRATAVAPDGVVEAIELDDAPVLGVQWELQEEWRVDPRFRAVFEWFAAAAGAVGAVSTNDQMRGRR
jgi:putative glutamine amidotransferase